MTYENLPKALHGKEIFCLWKYENDRNGRLTKPPYSAVTGKKAFVNRIDDFTCFDAAFSNTKNYDGLGIRLVYNLRGVDLYHCMKMGLLQTVLKKL